MPLGTSETPTDDWYGDFFAETPAVPQLVDTPLDKSSQITASVSQIENADPWAAWDWGVTPSSDQGTGESFLTKAANFLGKILGAGEILPVSKTPYPTGSSGSSQVGTSAATQTAQSSSKIGGISGPIIMVIAIGLGALLIYTRSK